MEYFVSYITYLVLFCVLLYMIKLTLGKRSRMETPPGPFSLPIIGNLFHVAFRHPHEVFSQLAKRYGDVFMFDFLGLRYVIVNSAQVAREALLTRKDDFSGRPLPVPYIASLLTGNGNDIVMADLGPELITKRKVVHSAIRMYGKNLSSIENKIGEEVCRLSEAIEGKEGKPFDPKADICLAVLNTIFAIVFKDRYSLNDPEFRKMAELTEYFNRMCFQGSLVNLMPWLSMLPLPSLKELREGIAYRDSVYKRRFTEHKESFDPENIRDLTDALIKTLLEENTAEQRDSGVLLGEDNLLVLINDVFVAGFETITTTLRWFLLYMIAYPEVQKKSQAEMDQVVGRDKLPELKHREHLPYTEALIAEVLRFSSVLPVGIPHKAIRDTKLAGYDIPKGTGLMINLWAIHHDEREWNEPNTFNPSRFLNDDGKFVGYGNQGFLPFGAGRRVCMGETLAKNEIFLIGSRLLHMFQFMKTSAQICLKTDNYYTNSPMPFELRAIPRS